MKKIQPLFRSALVVGAASILASGIACAQEILVSNNANNSIEEIVNGVPSTFVAPTIDLSGPTGLAAYGGNLFVANNATSGGGSGFVAEFSDTTGAFEGDYATGLNSPRGLVFDSFGNMYVANQNGGTIVEVPAGGGPAKTIVSGLAFAEALTFDSVGNLYVTNSNASTGGGDNIEKITLTDGTVVSVSVFAKNVNNPTGITYDTVGKNSGDFFVVDNQDSVVEYNSAGKVVAPSPFIKDLDANDKEDDITVDSAGDFYVTDNGDSTVTEYNSLGKVLKVYSSAAFSGPCFIIDPTASAVPEPSTYALLTAGLGLLVFLSRRKAAKV